MNGQGKIKLHPLARIIVLPQCASCKKLCHSCVCGQPTKRPAA